jgi:hypothetical protein
MKSGSPLVLHPPSTNQQCQKMRHQLHQQQQQQQQQRRQDLKWHKEKQI